MTLSLTSPPAVEPVSLAEIKEHLRVDAFHEDVLIHAYVTAARSWVETHIAQRLIEQAWRISYHLHLVENPLTLPLSPVIAIDRIVFFPANGPSIQLVSADYALDNSEPCPQLIFNVPIPPLRDLHAIKIDLRAGYGPLAEDVPHEIRHAIRLLTAHWYEHREATTFQPIETMAHSVLPLLARFQRVRL